MSERARGPKTSAQQIYYGGRGAGESERAIDGGREGPREREREGETTEHPPKLHTTHLRGERRASITSRAREEGVQSEEEVKFRDIRGEALPESECHS